MSDHDTILSSIGQRCPECLHFAWIDGECDVCGHPLGDDGIEFLHSNDAAAIRLARNVATAISSLRSLASRLDSPSGAYWRDKASDVIRSIITSIEGTQCRDESHPTTT